MYTLHLSESKKIELPGRAVYPMVGYDGLKSDRMAFGAAELPPKSKMNFHKHIDEQEIIYILQGFGKLHVKGGVTERIETGTVILAPKGLDHSLENESKEVMKWVWVFSPPVKIGSHASAGD